MIKKGTNMLSLYWLTVYKIVTHMGKMKESLTSKNLEINEN